MGFTLLAGQTGRTEGNPRQLGRSRPRLDTVAGERRAAAREYPRFRKPDTAGACRATVEVAPSYVFLASEESSYITAQIIGVTGRTLHSLNPATMRTPAAHPDRLTAEERRELDDNAFGIPSRREFPLVDAAHVRAARGAISATLPKPTNPPSHGASCAKRRSSASRSAAKRSCAGRHRPQSGNGRQLKKTYLCKKRCT